MWALFTFALDPSVLMRFVHTHESEWQSMYSDLAARLRSGLLCVAGLFFVAAIAFKRIESLYARTMRLPERRFLLIVLTAQAAICGIWLFLFPADVWADGISYHRLARGLAAGLGYIGEDGQPTAYYPIGYPFLLSLLYRVFGSSLWVGKLANAAMTIGVTYIWFGIAGRIWNDAVARTTALLMLVSLSVVSYVSILFSEIAFLFFLSLAIRGMLDLSRSGGSVAKVLGAGIMIGIATLIRPVAFLVPLAYAVAAWKDSAIRKKTLRRSAIVYALACVVILPNVVRNYEVFHSFVPVSTNGGINFWIGNNPDATGYYIPPTNVRLAGNEAEQSLEAYSRGMDWIVAHPGQAAVTFAKKFFHLYHRDDQGILFSVVKSLGEPSWTSAVVAIILDNILYYSIFVLAMRYVIRNRRILSGNERFFILLCLLMTGFHLLYFGAHRFHFPLNPLMAGFAAAGIVANRELRPSIVGM